MITTVYHASLTGKKPILPTEKKSTNKMRIKLSIQNHYSAYIEEKCHIQSDQEMDTIV
jgi:hypothetical protein